MTTFSPNGRAHTCLRTAEAAPASFADMCAAQGLVGQGKQRRKLFLALCALRSAGLMYRAEREAYALTEEGVEALRQLQTGQAVEVLDAGPRVRLFTRAS